MAYKITDSCDSCGACVDECPLGIIHEGDCHYIIDAEQCPGCGTCAEICPNGAIVQD